MPRVVFFSNYSGNTARFVEKLDAESFRIPLQWDDAEPLVMQKPFVLFVPTYGGGSNSATVPKQVKKFLAIEENRNLMLGVIGFGNTNFGDHFCRAAYLVSQKTGAPVLDKVEIFGTPADVSRVQNKLEELKWNVK